MKCIKSVNAEYFFTLLFKLMPQLKSKKRQTSTARRERWKKKLMKRNEKLFRESNVRNERIIIRIYLNCNGENWSNEWRFRISFYSELWNGLALFVLKYFYLVWKQLSLVFGNGKKNVIFDYCQVSQMEFSKLIIDRL